MPVDILLHYSHMNVPSMQKGKVAAEHVVFFCTLSFSHMKPLPPLSSAIRTSLWAFNYDVQS